MIRGTATALLALAAAHAAAPARAADLAIGSGVFAMSVDPHLYNGIADRALALHLYQRLVEQKEYLSIGPGLASAWQATSDTEWTSTLREDAPWSDGRKVTAEDVLFSLQRAPNLPNSPLGYGPLMRDVKKVEITSPTSLRITTAQASPNLPVNLAAISIVARHASEGATQSDFNSGKAAIAGGPYRLVRFATNETIELARNPAWTGPKPAWDKVVFRFIANDGARTAALLASDVDLIDAPGEADLPRLRTDPRLRVAQTPGNRSIFFLPDIGRETSPPFVTDAQVNKLAHNPLRAVGCARRSPSPSTANRSPSASSTARRCPWGNSCGRGSTPRPPISTCRPTTRTVRAPRWPKPATRPASG